MKLSALTLAAAAAGLASCQCVSSIPECAQSCLTIAASSVGCGETDYACQCTDEHQTAITTNATTCVLAACGDQIAINEVLPAASAFCSAINAGDTCSSASAGSTSSTAASSGSASSPSSSSPDSTLTATVSLTSTASGATATTGGSSSTASDTATASADSSGTGTATDASASASSTAGAATVGPVGSLGIAVLGALVML